MPGRLSSTTAQIVGCNCIALAACRNRPGSRVAALVQDTPLHRFGTPQEVAAMATFLASDESLYVTNSEMNIDGGLLAGSVAAPQR